MKLNTPVIVRGQPGRYVGQEDRGPGKGRGIWYRINVAPKGKPQEIRLVRPAVVTTVG